MEIGKTKKKEKRGSGGATRAFGFYSFVFFLPSFLPGRWDVDHARCFRYCSRERHGRQRHGKKKRQWEPGACERREENFEGERPRRADSRANVRASERDFVLTFARDCVSLTPHQAFRIPINSRRTSVVKWEKFMAVINTLLQDYRSSLRLTITLTHRFSISFLRRSTW